MRRNIRTHHTLKRRRQMKRRRIFWTFFFILLAAFLAYKAFNFAQDQFMSKSEIDKNITAPVQSAAVTQPPTTTTPPVEQAPTVTSFKVKQADAWQYVLVNKTHPLEQDFGPLETFLIQSKYKADLRIENSFTSMVKAAKSDGVVLTACSAYRTYDYQTNLFKKKKAKFSNLSDEEASIEAAKVVAKPGTSEHQTGLAMDIVTPSHTALDEAFADTEAGKWLKDNAYKYGFILRYPKDKTEETQIIFEPWHYRYVGKEAAKLMFNENLCFEEFVERIELE
jgi:D-alanyl-D-alanine carboxypeptidase